MREYASKTYTEDVDFTAQRPADLNDFTSELGAYLSRQDERKKTIDDKAKSCLIVITVSATVALAGLNLVKEGTLSLGYLTIIVLVLGAIYFLLSAITAVKALVVVGFATPHPNDWIRNREASKPLTIEKPDKTYLLYVITTQNDIELNIRANYLDATLLGLRNGVILLSVALGAALFDVNKQNSYINSPSGPQTTSSPASPKTPQNTEAILPEIPKTPDGPKRVKGAPLGERPSTKQTRDQHKR